MTIHVASDAFEIDTIPREQFSYEAPRTLVVQFYDAQERRMAIHFTNVIGLKMIHDDYVDHRSLLLDGKVSRTLLEVVPPQWESHYSTLDPDRLQRLLSTSQPSLKHFILGFRDRTLEILASEFSIEVVV